MLQPAVEPVAPDLLRSLREHVHERLRRAIVAGRFRNGERLNERHLAEMLGVSTTPVKDAIRKLESEGLVRTEARRGVFVEFSARQALEMALGRAALESVMTHIAANRIANCGALAKAAVGAADRIPVARVVNLSRALEQLAEAGWRAVGLDGSADTDLETAIDGGPLVIVMGSEGDGIRRLVAEHCDVLAKIPMPGGFESLNVSNAAAIALYEAARAQRG